MANYKDYTTEDFLQDELFRRWVLSPGQDTIPVWETFLSDYPEKQGDVIRARTLLLAIDQLDQGPSEQQGQKMWGAVLERIDGEGQIIKQMHGTVYSFYRYLGYAAALIVLGVSMWWLVSIKEFGRVPQTYENQVAQHTDQLIEFVNNTGKASRLLLPDGSIVVLSKQAKVSYQKGFDGSQRNVYLSGEGYFEVKKDDQKPFLVFTNNIVTQVVGTRFTVSSSSQSKDISVAVKSGKVKVSTIDHYSDQKMDEGSQMLLLTANQQANFSGETGILTKNIAARPEVIKTSEKYPGFNFKMASVEDVFATLGDSYGVTIEYDPKRLTNCNLTAELGNESLFKKLDIICRTIDATYEVYGTKIVVNAKGCAVL